MGLEVVIRVTDPYLMLSDLGTCFKNERNGALPRSKQGELVIVNPQHVSKMPNNVRVISR